MSVLEMEIEPERNPDFEVARARVVAAVQEIRQAFQVMLDLADPVIAHHDDMAELIGVSRLIEDLAGQVKPEMQGAVLAWLLQNVGGIREIRVGEVKYWGEKEKSTHCIDVGEAGQALAHIRLGLYLLLVAKAGEGEDAQGSQDDFWLATRDLFREVVSANGLKEGACRKVLEADAEAGWRREYDINPGIVEPLPNEAPEEALERVIEAAREEVYQRHWIETWPDKIAGGLPKTKLGVANMRFIARRGGGTKKDFEELERRRLAAGGEA